MTCEAEIRPGSAPFLPFLPQAERSEVVFRVCGSPFRGIRGYNGGERAPLHPSALCCQACRSCGGGWSAVRGAGPRLLQAHGVNVVGPERPAVCGLRVSYVRCIHAIHESCIAGRLVCSLAQYPVCGDRGILGYLGSQDDRCFLCHRTRGDL